MYACLCDCPASSSCCSVPVIRVMGDSCVSTNPDSLTASRALLPAAAAKSLVPESSSQYMGTYWGQVRAWGGQPMQRLEAQKHAGRQQRGRAAMLSGASGGKSCCQAGRCLLAPQQRQQLTAALTPSQGHHDESWWHNIPCTPSTRHPHGLCTDHSVSAPPSHLHRSAVPVSPRWWSRQMPTCLRVSMGRGGSGQRGQPSQVPGLWA